MKARAASIAADIEPELVFAVDAIFPLEPLIASLKALRSAFPHMPVSIFTETLGGSEQRLREGVAHFAIFPLADDGRRRSDGGLFRLDRCRSRRQRRSSARKRARADRARDARAACPARPDRPHAADPKSARRHRQPSHLALRRSFDPARIPPRRIRLVQHAASHGPRADRTGAAEGAEARRARPVPVPRPCRACARARDRPRRALAHRGLAGANGGRLSSERPPFATRPAGRV